MNKNLVVKIAISVGVLLLLGASFFLYKKYGGGGPVGNLSDEEMEGMKDWIVQDSGANGEGKEVTPKKYLTYLNAVLKGVSTDITKGICGDGTTDEEADKLKEVVGAAQKFIFNNSSKDKEELMALKGKDCATLKKGVSASLDESEESKKALNELLACLLLKGRMAGGSVDKFDTTYGANAAIKTFLDAMTDENKAVGSATVAAGGKNITVANQVFGAIYQASYYLPSTEKKAEETPAKPKGGAPAMKRGKGSNKAGAKQPAGTPKQASKNQNQKPGKKP